MIDTNYLKKMEILCIVYEKTRYLFYMVEKRKSCK